MSQLLHNLVDVQCACKQQSQKIMLMMNPNKIDAFNQNCPSIIKVGCHISIQSQAQ
jgi:hypothetical protein